MPQAGQRSAMPSTIDDEPRTEEIDYVQQHWRLEVKKID